MVAPPQKRIKRDWWERGERQQQARTWTPDRYFRLIGGIENGRSAEQIAKELGTTVISVRLARRRAGLPCVTAVTLNTRSVAKLMGLGCAKTVAAWIENGWLSGHRGQRRGPYRQWVIRPEDLESFLADPEHWHRWSVERITDPELRELALEVRTERYLTPGEVADRLFVTHAAVNNWIHHGILPAVRYQNWCIPESALEGFVPPGQRSRKGRSSRYTPEEDATIYRMRMAGAAYQVIANEMGRSVAGVCMRWHRMMSSERRSS